MFRGEPAVPAVLRVNGEEAALSSVVHAGDEISFIPAHHGEDAHRTLRELLGEDFYGKAMVNNAISPLDRQLVQGDVVLTLRQTPPRPAAPAAPAASWTAAPAPVQPAPRPREAHFLLNDKPLVLPLKEDGSPYYLMDLLDHSGIDFEHLDRPVRLEVNGVERGFQHALKEQDSVTITLA